MTNAKNTKPALSQVGNKQDTKRALTSAEISQVAGGRKACAF